jgi:hypothetical protein
MASAATDDLTSAHLSLLDKTVFRHTFYQKFSPNHIQAHISLNITQMYNNMTNDRSLYTIYDHSRSHTPMLCLKYLWTICNLSCDSPAQWHRVALLAMWSLYGWYLPLSDINSCIMKRQRLSEIVMSCSSRRWILWRVLILSKNQNNKLCNESACS